MEYRVKDTISLKNLLIIGGSGFIGSHLTQKCLQQGLRVINLDLHQPSLPESNNYQHIHGSLSDRQAVEQALESANMVFHLANASLPITSQSNLYEELDRDLKGTLVLLDAIKQRGPLPLTFLSSGGTVYGNPHQLPVTEEHSTYPISGYGVLKLTIEKYLQLYHHLYQIPVCIIRPTNVYGPGQMNIGLQGVIGTFLKKLAHNQPITIWGDGNVVRDYLYVDDLIELCLQIALRPQPGIYNASSGQGVSLGDLITTMEQVTGKIFVKNHIPEKPYEVQSIYCSFHKAYQTFGWKPQTSLEQGLLRVWSYYQV